MSRAGQFRENPILLTEHIGQKFNMLTIIEACRKPDIRGRQQIWYLCQCDCGNKKEFIRSKVIKGKVKHCGCLPNMGSTKPFGVACRNDIIDSYTRNATKRNLKITLNINDFDILIKQNCFYCGRPPLSIHKLKHKNGPFYYNGIDRLDNDEDYTIDNSITCCKTCNFAKTNHTFEFFIDWIFKVSSYLIKNHRLFPEKYSLVIQEKINEYFPDKSDSNKS